MRVYIVLGSLISVLSLPAPGYSATCSCAGAPLLSAIDTSASEAGDLFVNTTSEQHEISDLVQGTDDIPDEAGRERSSLSHTLSFSYGLSDRWAVSGLVSYIEHSRNVGTSFFGEQKSSGLGDGILMLRYTPLYITPFSRHELSLGLGARLPIGKDDAGGVISFSEDMQPGVGAPGTVFWAGHNYAFNQAATVTLNTSAYYTLNEEENDRNYKFGNEFVVGLGVGHSVNTKFSYSAGLRYRTTEPDERFGFDFPNTGGEWVDFIPALQYAATNNLTVAVSGRIPVHRKLDGALQFTTSYSYALSFTYEI